MKFLPNMYKKNIYEIPYEKLKKQGKKCLVFDLDNTLALIDEEEVPEKCIKLIKKLKKEFKVLIITNNTKDRVKPYEKTLDIDSVSLAMKPSTKGLKELSSKYHLKKNEIVMIGDQMITDIYSGNRFGVFTVLVDPLGEKDLKITGFNRFLEKRIENYYGKKGLFERGKYYG